MIPLTTPRPCEIYGTNRIPGYTDENKGWVSPRREKFVASTAVCYGFATESDGDTTVICAICELPDGTVEATSLKDIKFTDV